MRTVEIIRCQQNNSATIGMMLIDKTARFVTLELPWRDNKVNESCIPAGNYLCKLKLSPKFKMRLYELQDVPGRAEILLHLGNDIDDVSGCLAIGKSLVKSNYIGKSTEAFCEFMAEMKEQDFMLSIGSVYDF